MADLTSYVYGNDYQAGTVYGSAGWTKCTDGKRSELTGGYRYNSKNWVLCLKITMPENASSITLGFYTISGANGGENSTIRYKVTTTENSSTYKNATSSVAGDGDFTVNNPAARTILTINQTFKKNTTYYIYFWTAKSTSDTTNLFRLSWTSNSSNKGFYATYTAVSTYKLSISVSTGSSVTVNRTSSNFGSTGNLSNGATLYQGDKLKITFSASTGYNLTTHTVNSSTFTSGGTHTVSGAVAVVSAASVKSFTLTISAGTGTSITVKRTSSPKKGAATGNLSNGAAIYYSDELSVSFTYNTGYEKASQSHNNGTYTVTSAITFSATANLKKYTVTISAGENVSISVKNGTTAVSSGATVTHGTVLTVSYTYATGYENNSRSHAEGNHTITGNVTFSATAKKKKFTFTITGDEGVASVTGSGTYEYGSSAVTVAIAKEGYELAYYVDEFNDVSETLTDCEGLKTHEMTWEIVTNRNVMVTTVKVELGGTVSIKNGSAVNKFQIGIKGPDGFKLYGAYIKVNGEFKPYS